MTWSPSAGLLLILSASLPALASPEPARWFPDRPVAWQEHDDQDVSRPPAPTRLQEWDLTLLLRDSVAEEIDRVLSLEGPRAAQDVNALDEVPCSTWFCARNHLWRMSAAEVAAGQAGQPPRLPLTIVKGKDRGASPGFQVVDADGRKFMLKLDPAGHLGLSTGPEIVGQRLFHAAGYNVPGAFIVDLDPEQELKLDPGATFRLYGVQKRPLTADHVAAVLGATARTPEGKVRAAAVPWITGEVLGAFDMKGRRGDDPNDRIPHEHRRSLRASWVLFSWLSTLDASAINTLDSYVTENGRRFVRHHFIDFGAGLGGATVQVRGPHQGSEHIIEVGRTLAALVSLGLYRRQFQDDRTEWQRLTAQYPSVGWFPVHQYDPDAFRSNRKVPAHMRRTARDRYWGAKLVTSFSDDQIAAVVAQARLPAGDAAYLDYALRARRDIIGRRYLREMTAVENPNVSPDGAAVCFEDLAVARGHADPAQLRYQVDVSDGRGGHLLARQHASEGARTCVPLGRPGAGTGYRIVSLTALANGGQPARSARIHLRWRPAEDRFVVVGLERDE
jgi:hypothetical protein